MTNSVSLNLEWLIQTCARNSDVAALVWAAELEPVAGPGAPVQPAVYAGRTDNDPPRRSLGERWRSPKDEKPTSIVVVDGIASQANRAESALLAQATALNLPMAVLDLSDQKLPPHLLKQVPSWVWPHRVADASLIHSLLDGKPAYETTWGRSLLEATTLAAGPLVSWFPQALAYGFWQSHQGVPTFAGSFGARMAIRDNRLGSHRYRDARAHYQGRSDDAIRHAGLIWMRTGNEPRRYHRSHRRRCLPRGRRRR